MSTQTRRAWAFPQKANGLMFWVPGRCRALLLAVSHSWYKGDFLLSPDPPPMSPQPHRHTKKVLSLCPLLPLPMPGTWPGGDHTGLKGGGLEGSTV